MEAGARATRNYPSREDLASNTDPMALDVISRIALGALLAAGCGSSPTTTTSTTTTTTTTPAPAARAAPSACQTVQPIHPKVSRLLEADCFGSVGVREQGRLVVWVILAKDADPDRVKPAAEAVAGATSRLQDDRKIGGDAQLVLSVADAAQVLAVSEIEGVAWIEPSPVIKVD